MDDSIERKRKHQFFSRSFTHGARALKLLEIRYVDGVHKRIGIDH